MFYLFYVDFHKRFAPGSHEVISKPLNGSHAKFAKYAKYVLGNHFATLANFAANRSRRALFNGKGAGDVEAKRRADGGDALRAPLLILCT